MRKLSTFLLLFVLAATCHSATKQHQKNDIKQRQQPTENQSPSEKTNLPTGPAGLGPLKIGMQLNAISELKETDGVYLTEPLVIHENKYLKQEPGVDKRYTTKIHIPNVIDPIESILSFSKDQLMGIFLDISKSPGLYEKLKSDISEKYSQGIIKDEQKEEQCIYKNGANFKISTGKISTTWKTTTPSNDTIETTLGGYKFQSCPSNLMHSPTNEVETKYLNIKKIERSVESKKDSLF